MDVSFNQAFYLFLQFYPVYPLHVLDLLTLVNFDDLGSSNDLVVLRTSGSIPSSMSERFLVLFLRTASKLSCDGPSIAGRAGGPPITLSSLFNSSFNSSMLSSTFFQFISYSLECFL